jgi:hypothetical protein
LDAPAARLFGSPANALREAGIDPALANAPRNAGRRRAPAHWTEELILQTMRDLHQAGEDLRYRRMKEHSQPLFFAAKKLFGSYVNAVKQAGINYWQMSQAQLAKERAAVLNPGE